MKFLIYKIITRAGFTLATDQFWPADCMFDTPVLDVNWRSSMCQRW